MRVFIWVFWLCLSITSFAQNLPQQQPNNTDSYNVEVRFRRAYGTIGSDGSGGNNPDPAWQVKTANDIDGAPNSLLDNSRTVAGINNNAYCYGLTTLNNGWHPIQNALLGVYENNLTERVDFEVMSYENDYQSKCLYNADPPGQNNINDDDDMAYLESQLYYTSNSSGVYHNQVRSLTNSSQVEFRFIWRLASGERNAPLSFGTVNNCYEYSHTYTMRNKQESYQDAATYYQNDWTPSDHPNFAFGTQMTYIFYNDRDRRILLNQNSNEITAHLIKVDSSFNLLQYIGETSGDLDTTIALGLYAVVMENDEPTDTFDLSFRFEDAIDNPPVYTSNIVYVKEDGPVDGDGSSWYQATPFLQAAIHAASPGQQVWVAGGTYKPSTCGSEELYFYLDKNIEVYGGFSGVESVLQDRVLGVDTTFLTGEINDPIGFDNSKTVFRIDNTDRTALLNGLTITSAQRSGLHIVGASPTIDNCLFMGNNYSGIFISATPDTSSYPYIVNSTFTDNYSSEIGGGLFISSGINSNINNAIVTNCIFSDNSANYGGGGVAIAGSVYDSKITITNCTFHDNASNFGSAIFTIDSNYASTGVTATVRNSIFWNKDIFATRMIHGYSNTYINLVNSLIPFDNSADLQGTSSGSISDVKSLYNQDPLFANETFNDLRINHASPAIDAGNVVFNSESKDAWGRPRVNGSDIDLGAFENQPKAYVNKNAIGDGTGTSWTNASKELYQVLPESQTVWVAKGTYKPTNTLDRNRTFKIEDSTQLYGGFLGNEADNYDLILRDFELNETILSGDIGNLSDSLDNSHNVVLTESVGITTSVDGFTITDGNANGTSIFNSYGGGWLNKLEAVGDSSSPMLKNIRFINNTAHTGGAYANYGTEGVFLTAMDHVSFVNNTARFWGGAIYLSPSEGLGNQTLQNVNFDSNTALKGGAIYQKQNGQMILSEGTFDHNHARDEGGAIYMEGINVVNEPIFKQLTFQNNTAGDNGGGLYLSGVNGNLKGSFTDSEFINNSSISEVSDIYVDSFTGQTELTFTNCKFTNNQFLQGSLIKSICFQGVYKTGFENCVFNGHRQQAFNKEFNANEDSTRFNHCTFYGFENEVISNINSTPSIVDNSIFWNNGSITNDFAKLSVNTSIVDTSYLAGLNGNIMTDPKLIEPTAGVFFLNCGSPAIGLANTTTSTTEDITGFLRIGTKDAGAYEFRYENINQVIDGTLVIADIVNSNLTLDGMVVAPPYKIVQAEESILLNPGFLMQPGMGQSSVFKASIGAGCP